MNGIWNINTSCNMNMKKIFNKLSFELGEVFLAKVVDIDKVSKEIVLKLMDGWQFSAKLEKNLDFIPEGLVKFQVEGFENEKLKIKLFKDNNLKENIKEDASIENVLKEENINLDKKDYKLLKKMVKHNMPLTKENISKVKTLIDFMDKISQDNQEDNFISKYLQNKNIDIKSNHGKKIEIKLKNFFKELKNISKEDLLTLLENNISITEDNIKSFNKVFKQTTTIYKHIKELENLMVKNEKNNITKNEDINNNKPAHNKENNNLKEISKEQVIKNVESEEGLVYDKVGKSSEEKLLSKIKQASPNKIEQNLKEESVQKKEVLNNKSENITTNNNEKESINTILKDNIENLDSIKSLIKGQIESKVKEMKNILKNLLDSNSDFKLENNDKVIQFLQRNVNDFKIFNSISNQYYYLDIPINLNNNDYECKLIIKDDRKEGKKVDSKHAKIVTSIRTINMGVIDAYIKVINNNLDIDVACNKKWISYLNNKKEKVLKNLFDLGYNVYINIKEKKEEVNIVKCREFFEDNNLSTINIRA